MAPSTTETKTQTESNISTLPDSIKPTSKRGYAIPSEDGNEIVKGGKERFAIPEFEDPYKKRQWMKEHMAGAFRYFAREGYTEGVAGHISIRDPVDPHTFWINPLGKHFALIKASDLVQVDYDGNVIGGNMVAINGAGFAIHSALHKARPEVNAACHTHSIYGKAWAAFGRPIDMINQDSCTFYNKHGVYTDFGGVAIEKGEGEAIAKAIGDGNSAILQNHGLITVGGTVDEAAYLFGLLERTCKVQLAVEAAEANGIKKQIIGDEEAAYTSRVISNPVGLYMVFQSEYEYQLVLDKGDFLN